MFRLNLVHFLFIFVQNLFASFFSRGYFDLPWEGRKRKFNLLFNSINKTNTFATQYDYTEDGLLLMNFSWNGANIFLRLLISIVFTGCSFVSLLFNQQLQLKSIFIEYGFFTLLIRKKGFRVSWPNKWVGKFWVLLHRFGASLTLSFMLIQFNYHSQWTFVFVQIYLHCEMVPFSIFRCISALFW